MKDVAIVLLLILLALELVANSDRAPVAMIDNVSAHHPTRGSLDA